MYGVYINNDLGLLEAKRIAIGVAEQGVASFDVNPYGTYLLFNQWSGAKYFSIYYISCANKLIAKIASDNDVWAVSLSDDKSKLNISNVGTNNTWANYFLLKIN